MMRAPEAPLRGERIPPFDGGRMSAPRDRYKTLNAGFTITIGPHAGAARGRRTGPGPRQAMPYFPAFESGAARGAARTAAKPLIAQFVCPAAPLTALLARIASGGMIAGWNESSAAGEMIRVTKSVFACIAGLWAAAWSTAAIAQDSLSNANPEGSGVIVRAVQWLQGTLLGTIATVVAVIAVASVGFLMLTGRINWRYGATVILGCFILFGAASIVAGIQSTAGGN